MADPGGPAVRCPGEATAGFGPLLRRWRTWRLLSQEQLAERTGLSVRTIRNLESGRIRRPRGTSVTLLADVLGLPAGRRTEFEAAGLGEPPAPDRPGVPAQLPPPVSGFTGRGSELAALTVLSAEPVGIVSGTPGVGKTALVLHWAHRDRGRFPDGQLYADLRGYGPDRPLDAYEVLGRFLRALGVGDDGVPDDPDERAARFRTELAGRRTLVLLDNVATVEQVRPLLPGASSSVVLVTSRSDGLGLLRHLVGPELDADPAAAAALVDQCARLPLALRLAADLIAERPDVTPAELVGEFGDQHRRLDLLAAADDPASALRVVFSWSYGRLPEPAARAFRLLGLHPGADVGAEDVAALTGADRAGTHGALDLLVRAHLVEPRPGHRYGVHDLLRTYAAECAVRQEPAPERQRALVRLLDHYLRSALAATDLLFPSERDRRPEVRRTAGPVPALADADAALAWLDAERSNLVEAVVAAAGRGAPGHAVDLSVTLWRYLLQDHYDAARTVHGHALRAARAVGDAAGEATARHNLATVLWRRGNLEEALAGHEAALAIRCRLGLPSTEAHSLNNLAIVLLDLGRYAEAADRLEQALAIRRRVGDRLGEARTLGNLGIARERLGQRAEAIACTTRTLELSRELGDRVSEAGALDNLGLAHRRSGRLAEAYDFSAAALRLYRELGHPAGTATALTSLALVQTALGRGPDALAGSAEALELCQRLGDRGREAEALVSMGDALCELGRPEDAADRFRAAESLAVAAGNPYDQARALSGQAEVAAMAGRRSEADRLRADALALYEAMGIPESDRFRHRTWSG